MLTTSSVAIRRTGGPRGGERKRYQAGARAAGADGSPLDLKYREMRNRGQDRRRILRRCNLPPRAADREGCYSTRLRFPSHACTGFGVGLGDSARTPARPLGRAAKRVVGVLCRSHDGGSAVRAPGAHSPGHPVLLPRRDGRVGVCRPDRPRWRVGARFEWPQELLANVADRAGRRLRCRRRGRGGDRPAEAHRDRTSSRRRRWPPCRSCECGPTHWSPRA